MLGQVEGSRTALIAFRRCYGTRVSPVAVRSLLTSHSDSAFVTKVSQRGSPIVHSSAPSLRTGATERVYVRVDSPFIRVQLEVTTAWCGHDLQEPPHGRHYGRHHTVPSLTSEGAAIILDSQTGVGRPWCHLRQKKPLPLDLLNLHSQVHQRLPAWLGQRVVFCSTASPPDDVTLVYQNGLPVISVSLPSRRERCRFTLKPISDSVGVFLQQLQEEDRGIDRVAIYSTDGARVAASTGIEILLLDDFKLSINDTTYDVRPPKRELLSHEDATTLSDLKTLVQQLYSTLRIEEHQLIKERELNRRLEDLRGQLEPLEKDRLKITQRAEKRTTWVLWGGLAYMATQFGVLARLTWWEYSWDIMEPVTYFITYGSAMAMYAYFVLTRQEYIYPDARDRQYLQFFHKGVKNMHFDVEEYNRLKDAIAQAELDLKRLRDPLQVHLPIQQIDAKD